MELCAVATLNPPRAGTRSLGAGFKKQGHEKELLPICSSGGVERIACTVLCCAVHGQSASFFGGRSGKKSQERSDSESLTRGGRGGQGDKTAV